MVDEFAQKAEDVRMRTEELFSHYGYLMLLVGSLGEGMPIMLFGGFAAHRGWLVLMPPVILAGALGNAVAQGLWFFAARYAGEKIWRSAPTGRATSNI